MARSIYVTGPDRGAGKSAVALGLAELLAHRVAPLGVFRPLVVDPATDPTLALLTRRYRVEIAPDELYGTTVDEAAAYLAEGRREDLVAHVVERYRAVARRSGAVVVVGSDFGGGPSGPGPSAGPSAGPSGGPSSGPSGGPSGGSGGRNGVGLPRELAVNARLATEFGSVVVLAVSAAADKDVEESIRAAYHSLIELSATVVAVVVTRAPAGLRTPELPVPVYTIPDVPTLRAPTVAEVAEALHATVVTGDRTALGRDVEGFVVGAGQVPTVLANLRPGALVITPGDRSDLLLATAAAQVAGTASVAGVVLTLGIAPDPATMDVFTGLDPGLAVLGVRTASYETIAASTRLEHRLSTAYPRKVQAALGAFESSVDGEQLSRLLDVSRSARVTPMMFEHELIDRARGDRRIVLPEGTDDRILRAADLLLRRGIGALTLLGDTAAISRRARELGLDLGPATLIDPATSDLRDGFAEQYAELRRHRGVTVEAARDTMRDVNYFGTMMVHCGLADGMVSGAAHTTAATLRPAFEVIRTRPEVSVASSVFLMLLPDRVLVYGDCAVNPDPDAAQLADIALSSAETAVAFGVEPRLAMLSYSTGTSGAGADVTKVAEATAIVRERRPGLPVEGPIQYDAAVDPVVAAAKLPGSAVAGHASVFIFPDLNTGNNTYKAVQRSANAVAVGPILQGLRRPVNDLSRGATVKDIVNTVAITAVQAQPTST